MNLNRQVYGSRNVVSSMGKLLRSLVASVALAGAYAASPIDSYSVLALDGTALTTDLSTKSTVTSSTSTPTIASIRGQSGIQYANGSQSKAVLKTGAWTLPTSFTLEAEVLVPAAGSAASGNFFNTKQADGTTTAWSLQWATNTGLLKDLTFYLGTTAYTFKTQIAPDQWVHVAVSRDSSKALRLFVNGVLVNSFTNVTASPVVPAGAALDIGAPVTGQNATEYMRHVLVSFGLARYTAAFNADTGNLDWPGGTSPNLPKQSTPAIDSYTVLAVAGDQLIESSGNRHVALDPASLANAAVVAQGNSQGIGFSNPDGPNAALRASKVDGWALPNVFTLETDVYLPASGMGSVRNILGVMTGLTGNCGFKLMVDATNSVSWVNENKTYSFGRTIWSDEWIALAVTQDASNTVRMFINGEMVATATRSNGCSSASLKVISPMYQLGLGDAYPTTTGAGNAKYLRHVNISSGIARYVADYNAAAANLNWPTQTQGNTTPVPPAGQVGTVDSYSVLALRGDSYTELSGKAVLSNTATTSILAAGGFKSIGFLDPSTNPKSLLATLSVPWALPPQFTIETDVFVPTSNTSSTQELVSIPSSAYNQGWSLSLSGSKITFSGLSTKVTSVAITKNKWAHIAVTRDVNNTLRIFLNGALVTTATNVTGKGDNGAYDGMPEWPNEPQIISLGGVSTKNGRPFYQKNINVSFGVTRYLANYNSKAIETNWGVPATAPVSLPVSASSVVKKYVYGDDGNMAQSIDGKGNATSYGWTYQGLVSITTPKGAYTAIWPEYGTSVVGSPNMPYRQVSALTGQYLNASLQSGETDSSGNWTMDFKYAENAFGDLTQITSPDAGVTNYEYNDAGSVTKKTNALNQVVNYTYDVLERLKMVSAGTINYSYEYGVPGITAAGKLTSVTGGGASITLGYDASARLETLKQAIDAVALTQTYSYNTKFQLSGLKLPSGAQLSYEYVNGNISAIKLNGQPVISNIRYGAGGSVVGWNYANGLQYGAPLDEAGRVAAVTLGSAVQALAYDADGNVQSTEDNAGGTRNFIYTQREDVAPAYNVDALSSAVVSGTAYSYKYKNYYRFKRDTTRVDNANQVTYSYDMNSNRLNATTGAVAKTYSYDLAGNLLTEGTITNVWDGLGKLSSSSKAGVTTLYEYDGLGHRFRKGAATKTLYAYDAKGNLLGEYDAAGSMQREYIYLGNVPIGVWTGGQVYAVHPDHLGTPRAVTNASATSVWSWSGEPFGATMPTGTFTLNLRHPGQYYDVETGWFYNNARYYDPSIGQYISSDPIGLDGGVNTYAYVGGNPLGAIDPKGLNALSAAPVALGVGILGCAVFSKCRQTAVDMATFVAKQPGEFVDNVQAMSDGWGEDGKREYPDHNDRNMAMSTNCNSGPEDVAWAIKALEADIVFRKIDLKLNCGDANNARGKGHRDAIKANQDKIDSLKKCGFR